MSKTITLDNIAADEGRGYFYRAGADNCSRQTSSQTPGDGAPGSIRIIPSSSGECLITPAGSYTLVSSHKYYISFKVKYESAANCTFDFYWPIEEPPAVNHAEVNAEADTWVRVSTVFTRESFPDGSYRCRFDYNNEDNDIPVRQASFMLFDLTEAFGAGKEPSKEWLDTHITTFGDSLTVHYVENLEDLFTDIADAIRAKKGTTDKIFACDFADRIRAL